MRKQATFSVSLVAALFVTAGGLLPARLGADEAQPMVREIFVPFEDLEVLMEAQPRRVLLERSEYEALLEKAAKKPAVKVPLSAAIVSADYTGTIESGRAQIVGKLTVDVLEEGILAVDLDLSGVGLRRATLDGRSAAIGRSDQGGEGQGRWTLFVEGAGPHELVLEMAAPLETTAAKQQLRFHLPRPPATKFQLTVPGDVEVKGGAHVISREVDSAAGVTRFELLPEGGDTTLLMTLNSRLLRTQRAVAAKSVLVDEVTEGYERLHATLSLRVLHRPVDQFKFQIPEGFEVTDVASPLLARWAIQSENHRAVLEVHLREQTTETVLLNVSAVRTTTDIDAWSFPKLVPLDVVAQVAVVGLLVDERLNAESIASEGLIPIDTSVLREAMPETVFQAAPGAPTLRPVVAWYAPQADFAVTARLVKPPKRLDVTTNLLLVLDDAGQQVQGGFLLRPEVEKLFAVDFSVPPGWHVQSVTGPDEKPLAFERYGEIDQAGRIRVSLPEGVSPGEEYRLYFQAKKIPAGWLTDWQSQETEFPVFAVAGAVHDLGAVAIDARDDLVVRPDTLDRLTPLDASERERYLPGVAAALAYRYEGDAYRATFAVGRTSPRLTARTFSFIRVEPDALACHYEVIFTVEEARARRLALLLPADTPETLSINGLDGVRLKEFVGSVEGDQRRWDIQLADPVRGRIRLAVDFQQPLEVENQRALALPILGAANVAWQSGLLAVEGHTELVVDVSTGDRARGVDVGELVDADYQPGRRLLGAFGFVGAPPAVSIDVARESTYALSQTIVERAELLTRLSAHGQSQTAAVFELRTKAAYLEIQLPAGAELWSADLNATPIKPQREGQKLLVGLPAAQPGVKTVLRLVYESPVEVVEASGEVRMTAPQLFLRSQRDEPALEVPTADLRWRLQPPPGYRVIDSDGTVVAADEEPPELAMLAVAKAAGGLFCPWVLGSGLHVYQSASMPFSYDLSDDAQYAEPAVDFMFARERAGAEVAGDQAAQVDAMMQKLAEKEERDAPAATPPPPMPAEEPPAAVGAVRETRESAARSELRAIPGVQVETLDNLDVMVLRGDRRDMDHVQSLIRQTEKLSRLDGFRSLLIDLEQGQGPGGDAREVSFVSLGVKPELSVRLAPGFRLDGWSWAVGAAVALVGAMLTCSRVRRKARYVVWMMLSGTLVGTLAPTFPGWSGMVGPANAAVYAAGLLIPYYVAAGFIRWCLGLCCGAKCAISAATQAAAATVVLLLCPIVAATAAEPKSPDGRFVIQVVEPPEPVTVPVDAVILPYDPDSDTGIQNAERMLVPYDKYVELWNRAYPDRKIETRKPPADFGLAGASYSTVLEGTDYLLIEGRLEIDVFSDRPVTIPLSLAGGVLARAELDGKPARLSVPQIEPPANNAPQQKAQQQVREAGPQGDSSLRSLVVLHAEGKGRHELQVTVRMRLDRRGGWRVAQGALPSAAASAMTVRVPETETEVRMSRVADRTSYETETPGEVIETALGPGGSLNVEWRPKVAEADVDQSLTVESTAVLDVQEDGLRLSWELGLEFRRSQRDRFLVQIPGDYLLEKVSGTNVRGWEIEDGGPSRIVEISLLKAARDGERFTLSLWHKGAVASGATAEFDAPVVKVGDAALHAGQLTIRRSPFLEVRTVKVSGASRVDLAVPGANANQDASTGAGSEESPLGIRPFQAYRFPSSDYAIRLAASPVVGKSSAEVQTVLRVAEYERSLESRITLRVEARPIHQIEILLPADLELTDVSTGGEFQWALTRRDDRPLLTVYLAAGQTGSVPVLVTGKLPLETAGEPIPLPNIKVLGVDRQEGDLAVQVDPAFAVAAQDLRNCQEVLPERLYRWLDEKQRSRVNTLPLHYRGGDYGGLVKLTPRVPEVDCSTVTNVRATDRAVEETILLDFSIRKAGIREVSFLLPDTMADCRIEVPMLRQKTIEPENDQAGARLRVRLELQDEVMNQFRVLVENDRLLEPDTQYQAPIPVVEKGDRVGEFSVRHFVALESAGRDELVVDSGLLSGLESLSRQQEDWKELQRILGDGITQAYLVAGEAADSRLVFRTRQRTAFETPGAEIGLAEATLVFDASGAYRAEQIFWIDNQTEQFLDVRLPGGAQLWTAQLFTHGQWTARESGTAVSGEPVKPTEVPGAAAAARVRVPLVRTQPGDLDYVVRLTYGGRAAALDTLSEVEFPLIHTENIQVGLSQVRLYLPESHGFEFDGTMRLVDDREELSANRFAYQTKKAESLREVLRHANPFAKARAINNLKQLEMAANQIRATLGDTSLNARLEQEVLKNGRMLADAQQEIQELGSSMDQDMDGTSNRARLRVQLEEQQTARARNVVTELGKNFDAEAVQPGQPARPADANFNSLWLDKSQLSNQAFTKKLDGAKDKKASPAKGDAEGKSRVSSGKSSVSRRLGELLTPGISQKPAAGTRGAEPADQERRAGVERQSVQQVDEVARYQRKHLQQQMAETAPPAVSRGLQLQRGRGGAGSAGMGGGEYGEALRENRAGQTQVPQAGRQGGGQPSSQPVPDQYGAYPPPAAGQRGEQMPYLAFGRPTSQAGKDVTPGYTGRGYGGMAAAGTELAMSANGEQIADLAFSQVPAAAALPVGLASLDVQLPQRGELYLFTKPRGDAQITARAVSRELIGTVSRAILAVALALLALLLVRWGCRGRFDWVLGSWGSTCLILLFVLIPFLPLVGLLGVTAGVMIKINRWRFPSRSLGTRIDQG